MGENKKYYDLLNKRIHELKNKKIIFWGASLFLRKFLETFDFDKSNILGIIDKHPDLQGSIFCGFKIYSPQDLRNLPEASIILTVLNYKESVYAEVIKYLKDNNFHKKFDFYTPSKFVFKYCPYCDMKMPFMDFGSPVRKNVCCSGCWSLERHRFLYFVYKMLITPKDGQKIKILHIAPEQSIRSLFFNNKNYDYTCIDLSPERYVYAPECKKMNVLDLSFNDNSFDFVIANHVAEHIEDEKGFLEQILRVLKPDGKIIMTVPIANMEKTFELPSVKTDEERLKYYGQKDHVRRYGLDVFERFGKYGKVSKIGKDIFSKETRENNGMSENPNEFAIIIEKRG